MISVNFDLKKMQFTPGNLYRLRCQTNMFFGTKIDDIRDLYRFSRGSVKLEKNIILTFLDYKAYDHLFVKVFLYDNKFYADTSGTMTSPEEYFREVELE